MTTPHSPAPWTAERDSNGELAIWDTQDNNLLHSDSRLPRRQRVANAQLMAASPALLAALQVVALTPHILAYLESEDVNALQQINDAIALTLQPIPGEDDDDANNTEECQDCDKPVVEDDAYYATPCGTFCDECMAKHVKACGICADEFSDDFNSDEEDEV